jgi:transcriptional regulator with XRE-family HTH domain
MVCTMPKEINPVDLLKRRQGDKSLRQFAVQVGVSAAYLSDLYRGNRFPGPRILHFLGLKRNVKKSVVYSYKKA